MQDGIPQAEPRQGLHEPHGDLSYEALVRARLDFAERCFVNAQELTRFIDYKANFLLAAVALLTAALGIVASKALDVQPAVWPGWGWLRGLSLVSFLAYVAMAFAVIFNATRVYRVMPSQFEHRTAAPGLIYPLLVMSRFTGGSGGATDEEQYRDMLSSVRPADILHDYANQIVEISAIYERKQRAINASAAIFQWLTVSWVLTILLLLTMIIAR
jgi:hypothetical protein